MNKTNLIIYFCKLGAQWGFECLTSSVCEWLLVELIGVK